MIKTVLNPNGGRSAKLTFKSKIYQKVGSFLIHIIPFIPSRLGYNITISKEKKFVWFRVAKVGTRTILGVLKESGIYLDAEHSQNCHYPASFYRDYFKFAFVRNPYDRLVSCWLNKVVNTNYFNFSEDELQRMQVFGCFVDYVEGLDIKNCDVHLRLQSELIDLSEIDFLGRLENFDEDFSYVLKVLKIDAPSIETKNSSSGRKDYKEYYNDELITKVAEIYQKDLNIFSYEYK